MFYGQHEFAKVKHLIQQRKCHAENLQLCIVCVLAPKVYILCLHEWQQRKEIRKKLSSVTEHYLQPVGTHKLKKSDTFFARHVLVVMERTGGDQWK